MGPVYHDANFFHGVALAAAGAGDRIPDLDGAIADSDKADNTLNGARYVQICGKLNRGKATRRTL